MPQAVPYVVAAIAAYGVYSSDEASRKAAAYEDARVKAAKEAGERAGITLVESAVAQEQAAKETEAIAAQEREAKELEVAEAVRRTGKEYAGTEATARAKAGASGVASGSMELSIETMMQEHARELEWMKTSGEIQADIITQQGATAAGIGRAGARGTRARGEESKIAAKALQSKSGIIKAKGLGSMLAGIGTVATTGEKAKWW